MIRGNGTPKKKIATKASAAMRDHDPVAQRALADAHHRLDHDREHRGLQAEEQRRDEADIAAGRVDVAEAMMATTPGTMNSTPAMMPPAVRCISQPI